MLTWFRNQKLMVKLMTGSVVVGTIMTGLGMLSLHNLREINGSTENLYQVQLTMVSEASEIQTNLTMVLF